MEIQPKTWGAAELGCFMGLEPKTIIDRLSRAPHRLPPRIKKTGQRDPARWLPDDVVAWARGAAAQAVSSTSPATTKRGAAA